MDRGNKERTQSIRKQDTLFQASCLGNDIALCCLKEISGSVVCMCFLDAVSGVEGAVSKISLGAESGKEKKNLLFKWKGNLLNTFLFSFVDSFTIFVFFLWLMPMLSCTRSRTHPNHSAWTILMDFLFFFFLKTTILMDWIKNVVSSFLMLAIMHFIAQETEGMLQQLSLASNVGSSASTAAKQYQRHEASERLIKKYSSFNNCLGPEEISKPGYLELTNLEVEYLCIWVCRNTYGFRSPKVVKITHQDKSGKLISISTSWIPFLCFIFSYHTEDTC